MTFERRTDLYGESGSFYWRQNVEGLLKKQGVRRYSQRFIYTALFNLSIRMKAFLQPQPLNILNPRQNNIAGQIRKPWKCENRFVQKCFQLLLAGGDGVDVETAAAGNLVDLGDNIAVLKYSAAF